MRFFRSRKRYTQRNEVAHRRPQRVVCVYVFLPPKVTHDAHTTEKIASFRNDMHTQEEERKQPNFSLPSIVVYVLDKPNALNVP